MIDELKPIEIARHYIPTNCSFCGAKEVRTLETRPNRNAIRRRKHCLHCGKRETTYEISQLRYDQLQAIDKIRAILLGGDSLTDVKSKLNCSTCTHWAHNKCGMDFPEAGGAFANDCSCYQVDQ
jgi:hypothetical protein